MPQPWWKKQKRRRRLRRRPRPRAPELTEKQILAWADAFHARTGRWPTQESGHVTGAIGEKWKNLDKLLRTGGRGLPGGSSLARLLAEKRGKRNPHALPKLSHQRILAWADAYHRRTGNWPRIDSGPIPEAPGETWSRVVSAMDAGSRGLPRGISLARLLTERRGVRSFHNLSPLSIKKILTWADAHRRQTGAWPTQYSGPIPDSGGETWAGIQGALRHGRRKLPRGSSLTCLLAKRRGLRHSKRLSPLSIAQVLAWADDFQQRTGQWPKRTSGRIPGTEGETWGTVAQALERGRRGLVGAPTLAQLLAAERGVRNIHDLPPLTEHQILCWADRHHERFGRWPNQKAGPVADAPGETWAGIDSSLAEGRRDLPRRSSLAQLLAEHRGVRNVQNLPRLTEARLISWARAHQRRTGSLPRATSGPIIDAPGENWQAVDAALRVGVRGFRGGLSLARLLEKHGLRKRDSKANVNSL